MSNLHIVTGFRGEPHVKAEDHGALNAAVFGSGEYVLKNGNQFAATVVSNNQVRVLDGCIMMQGRHIRLEEGSYVDLSIENGSQDTYRNDLIVARYTKDATSGVEDCNLVVIKGTAVSSNPADPAYTSGDIINDHALQNDMLLYRVPLVGLNVQALVPLFSTSNVSFQDFGSKQDKTDSLTAGTTISDGDYFPFYDVSETANRKTLWSNIVAKIRTTLFGTINGVLKADGSGTISVATVDNTPTASSSNLVTSSGVKNYVDTNAAVPSKAVVVSISGWSSNKATISVSGVTASNNVIVTPHPDYFVTWTECMVRATSQSAGKLTFTCEETPSGTIKANVLIVG